MSVARNFESLDTIRAATVARSLVSEAITEGKSLRILLTNQQAAGWFGVKTDIVQRLRALAVPHDQGLYVMVDTPHEIAREAFLAWRGSQDDSDVIAFGKGQYLDLVSILQAPPQLRKQIATNTIARMTLMLLEEEGLLNPGTTEYIQKTGDLEEGDMIKIGVLLRQFWDTELDQGVKQKIPQFSPDEVIQHTAL